MVLLGVLSPLDMIVFGVAGLLLFGPDQLPKVMRKVGGVVRDVQMTSQSFIREMERAADDPETQPARPFADVEHLADPTPAPHPWAEEILPESAALDDFGQERFDFAEPAAAPEAKAEDAKAGDGLKD
ncbi:MAG: twin-arginine translocase TatA/TatE family subunit [Candidatus Eremiobacteraeota bacterium]|nr:twin-arginine translocase TatA/TatE family subunit [Candidatus Eremiobacteraeota bacterium]